MHKRIPGPSPVIPDLVPFSLADDARLVVLIAALSLVSVAGWVLIWALWALLWSWWS